MVRIYVYWQGPRPRRVDDVSPIHQQRWWMKKASATHPDPPYTTPHSPDAIRERLLGAGFPPDWIRATQLSELSAVMLRGHGDSCVLNQPTLRSRQELARFFCRPPPCPASPGVVLQLECCGATRGRSVQPRSCA